MQRVSHNRESARCKYMQSEILIQDRNCNTVTNVLEFDARSDGDDDRFVHETRVTVLQFLS